MAPVDDQSRTASAQPTRGGGDEALALHVELVGPPGSGKSACARLLREILRSRGDAYLMDEVLQVSSSRRCSSESKRIMYRFLGRAGLRRLRHLLHDPTLLMRSLVTFQTEYTHLWRFFFNNQLSRGYDRWERTHDLTYVQRLCAVYQLAKETFKPEESLVLDEGFAYIPVRTIGHGEPMGRADLEYYLRTIPRPNVLVRLSCPPEVCDRRIFRRPSGPPQRLGTLPERERLEAIRWCDETIADIANILSREGVAVATVETSPGLKEVGGHLEEGLKFALR